MLQCSLPHAHTLGVAIEIGVHIDSFDFIMFPFADNLDTLQNDHQYVRKCSVCVNVIAFTEPFSFNLLPSILFRSFVWFVCSVGWSRQQRSFLSSSHTQHNLVDDENVDPIRLMRLVHKSEILFVERKYEKFFPHLGGYHHFDSI